MLGQYLADRRDAILEATRRREQEAGTPGTAQTLSKAQFEDHIPPVLEGFARGLQTMYPDDEDAAAPRTEAEGQHGLHRWQQGYRLRELLHEWGYLHQSLFEEVEAFAAQHPGYDPATFVEAHRRLIQLINEAVSESTARYARLQQDEAAGHARDLKRVLDELRDLDRSRARFLQQAVHDLRGSVQSVSSAADVLSDRAVPENERAIFLSLLQQGLESVSTTIASLMDLARLEAGQERRVVAPFDAAETIRGFCAVAQSVARERQLYLTAQGPDRLLVEGDAAKVQRILQNLVLNALKYTVEGGVAVSWGADDERAWWLAIEDTGPGLLAGPGAPVALDFRELSPSAPPGHPTAKEPPPVVLPARQQPGEGVGLSIVKRFCELLDASLELSRGARQGTRFRIVFPRRYTTPAER